MDGIDQQIAQASIRVHAHIDAMGKVAHAIISMKTEYALRRISREIHFPARSAGQINRWKRVKSQQRRTK